jgi:Fe-S-cluster containining protein
MKSRVIACSEYDIVVPFVCHRCGNCCRNYYPAVEVNTLPEIAGILNRTIHEIQDRLNEDCDAHNSGRPVDCFFLEPGGSRCHIHEVKPDGCRWFPSLTQAGPDNVDCPGYREFNDAVKALCRREIPAKKFRRIPDSEWQGALKKLEAAAVSERFIRQFILKNRELLREPFLAGEEGDEVRCPAGHRGRLEETDR